MSDTTYEMAVSQRNGDFLILEYRVTDDGHRTLVDTVFRTRDRDELTKKFIELNRKLVEKEYGLEP